MIHVDILKRILNAPMALCDLSTRNPNVMFELGLRQAFDKSIVIVQEVGTPQIFDVGLLRHEEYRKTRLYHEVIEDQDKIARAIRETDEERRRGGGVNSLVKLLALTQPAALPEVSDADKDPRFNMLLSAMNELRSEFADMRRQIPTSQITHSPTVSPNSRRFRPSTELGDFHIIQKGMLPFLAERMEIKFSEATGLVEGALNYDDFCTQLAATIRADEGKLERARLLAANGELKKAYDIVKGSNSPEE